MPEANITAYIKVEAREETWETWNALRQLDVGPHKFGRFYPLLDLGSYCRVLRFEPYSTDVHPEHEDFSEKGEALDAALRHLDEEGFDTGTVDLEGFLDSIKTGPYNHKED